MRQAGSLLVVRRALAVIVLSTGASWHGLAQEPASTAVNGRVAGRVLTHDGPLPLRRARIEVRTSGRPVATVHSDENGHFMVEAPDDTPGVLRVSKAGFAARIVDIASADRAALEIRLAPGAVITGRLIDPAGDPVAGVRIGAHPIDGVDGVGAEKAEYDAETDDLGDFRIGSLPAGLYRLTMGALSVPAPHPVPTTRDLARLWAVRRIAVPVAITLTPEQSVQLAAGEQRFVHLVFEPDLPAERYAARFAEGYDAPSVNADEQGDSGSLRGRVTRPDGRPARGTLVRLVPSRDGERPRVVATDEAGTYVITGVTAGTYRLVADAVAADADDIPASRVVQVRRGQQLNNLDVTIPGPAAVTGRIWDEHGEALEGLTVFVLHRRYVSGRVVLAPVQGAREGRTDDRGAYRLHGLMPGSYYIVATETPDQAQLPAMARPGGSDWPRHVYYPGRQRPAQAVPVQLENGVTTSGIDMEFSVAGGARVSGRVTGSPGRPTIGVVLLFPSARSGAPLTQPAATAIREDGTFELFGVPDGEYVVHVARTAFSGAPLPFNIPDLGSAYVTVAGAEAPFVTVRTSPGSSMTGTIVLEGDSGDVRPESLRLSIEPSDPDQALLVSPGGSQWSFRPDWTFEARHLMVPGRIGLQAPEGWYLKSAVIQGIDAAVEPYAFGGETTHRDVRVVISSRSASVTGRVRRGDAWAPDYRVIAFATDGRLWYDQSPRVRTARADQNGAFTIGSLPPGEYWIAAYDVGAVTQASGEWPHPDVLLQLTSSARRITLSEGQQPALELRLAAP